MHQAPLPTELQSITKDMTVQTATNPGAVMSQNVAFNLLDEFERLKADDSRLHTLNAQNTILRSQVSHLGSQLNWMSARHVAEKDELLEENAALADTILILRREIQVLQETERLRNSYGDDRSPQWLPAMRPDAGSQEKERLGFFRRRREYVSPGLSGRSSQTTLAMNDDLRYHGSTITTSDQLRHHSSSIITSDRLNHHSSSVLTDGILSHHSSSVLIGAFPPGRGPAPSCERLGK